MEQIEENSRTLKRHICRTTRRVDVKAPAVPFSSVGTATCGLTANLAKGTSVLQQREVKALV